MDGFKFAWHLDKKNKKKSISDRKFSSTTVSRKKKTCPYTIYTSVHINMRI